MMRQFDIDSEQWTSTGILMSMDVSMFRYRRRLVDMAIGYRRRSGFFARF